MGGVFLISNLKRTGVLLFVAMFLIGCSSSTDTEAEKTSNESEGSPEVEVEVETTAKDYEEYPLPILAGWAEDETSFKTIGNGTIDLWNGQFTFEEEIDVYFEPYQEALKELGYEVTVTDDLDGRKTLAFEQVIEGDKYEGFASFSQGLNTASVQRFK